MSTIARIQLALGGAGAAVPAIAYFTSHAPPLFEGAGPLVTVLGLALLYLTGAPEKGGGAAPDPDRIRKMAILLLVVSFLTLGAYAMLLAEFSLLDPTGNERLQIGFGTAEWSLTPHGLTLSQRFPAAPFDWMTYEQWAPGATRLIWKPWTVYGAGTILLVCFMVGFGTWCAGLGLLSKHQQLSEG